MRITICCDWCKLHQQTIAWKFFSNSSNFHRIASSLKFTPNQRVLKKFLKLQLSFCNSRPADHFIGHITFLYLTKLLLKGKLWLLALCRMPYHKIVILPMDHLVKGMLSYKKMHVAIGASWINEDKSVSFAKSSNFQRILSSLKFHVRQRVL